MGSHTNAAGTGPAFAGGVGSVIPALIADGQAIQKEAGIVGKATSNAMRGATGGGEATAPDQGGDASSMSDEELKKKLGIQ